MEAPSKNLEMCKTIFLAVKSRSEPLLRADFEWFQKNIRWGSFYPTPLGIGLNLHEFLKVVVYETV